MPAVGIPPDIFNRLSISDLPTLRNINPIQVIQARHQRVRFARNLRALTSRIMRDFSRSFLKCDEYSAPVEEKTN